MNPTFGHILTTHSGGSLRANLSGLTPDGCSASDLNMLVTSLDSYGNATSMHRLDVAQIRNFYSFLSQFSLIRDSGLVRSGRFLEIKEDSSDLLNLVREGLSFSPTIISAILRNSLSNGHVQASLESLSSNEIQELTTNHLHIIKSRVVADFNSRLGGNFSETSGDDSWQRWIYQNSWIMGAAYYTPIEKSKINLTGVMPDFLFPTHDGFLDILEIKLPEDQVLKADTSHPGSWYWSSETNKAIGQVTAYLSEMDRLRLEIESQIRSRYRLDYSALKPRAFVLIGNDDSWGDDRHTKLAALRKLNRTLNGIEVLTYAELLRRSKNLLSVTAEQLLPANHSAQGSGAV